MSISLTGISLLYCVCKCNSGSRRAFNPAIHILAGENVCIQTITPAQFLSEFAFSIASRIAFESITTDEKRISQGSDPELFIESTISLEFFSTKRRVSGP